MSKKPKHKPTLNQLFNNLLKEATTMHEARKRRIGKTKKNIMRVKTRLSKASSDLVKGSLERHHVEVILATMICGDCGESYEHIQAMNVWSKCTHENECDNMRLTSQIRGRGMYEFHMDLPVKLQKTTVTTATCAQCIAADISHFNSRLVQQHHYPTLA